MRHGAQNRRPRGKGFNGGGQNNGGARRNNGGGSYNRNQIFDSNGPDVRIRGTAHQVCEKYLTLAKDAASAGDNILAESYLQHAEHYQRIINTWVDDTRENFRPQAQGFVQPQNTAVEDDLSLPVSILGGEVKAASDEAVRGQSFQDQELLESA